MTFGDPNSKLGYTLNLTLSTTEEQLTVVSSNCLKSTC